MIPFSRKIMVFFGHKIVKYELSSMKWKKLSFNAIQLISLIK